MTPDFHQYFHQEGFDETAGVFFYLDIVLSEVVKDISHKVDPPQRQY